MLRERGFFVREIDYKNDSYYRKLSKADRGFATELVALERGIKENIEPYILYHEVIKEYFDTGSEPQHDGSVRDQLIRSSTKNIINMLGEQPIQDMMDPDAQHGSEEVDETLKKIDSVITTIDHGESMIHSKKRLAFLKPLIDEEEKELDVLQSGIRNFLVVNQLESMVADEKRIVAILDTKEIKTILDTVNHLINHFRDSVYDLTDSTKASAVSINKLLYQASKYQEQSKRFAERKAEYNSLYGVFAELAQQLNVNPDAVPIKQLDSILDKNRIELENYLEKLVQMDEFYRSYLKSVLKRLEEAPARIKLDSINDAVKPLAVDYMEFNSRAYTVIYRLLNSKRVSMSDIKIIENVLLPDYLKLGAVFNADQSAPSNRMLEYSVLINLLKMKVVSSVPVNVAYRKNLLEVLKLIAGLNDLDKAETYQRVLSLMQTSTTHVADNLDEGQFKDTYNLFSNAVKKYTVINYDKQYVEVDAISFIDELQQYYNRNNPTRFQLYLTLGLNQNLFLGGDINLPGSDDEGNPITPISYIGFASEKLGLKWRLKSFHRYKDYEYAIKSDVSLNRRAPYINEWYFIAYGSGLLYNIANTTTNTNFNYAHVGLGSGVRFYNALDVNLTFGFPFIKNHKPWKYAFVGLSLDVPLGEYLEKLGRK